MTNWMWLIGGTIWLVFAIAIFVTLFTEKQMNKINYKLWSILYLGLVCYVSDLKGFIIGISILMFLWLDYEEKPYL